MVVVLIIGILVAIALPTFLGARERAQNRAGQSDLRNALAAAKVVYTDNSSYAAFDDAGVAVGIEPSLTWVLTDAAAVAGSVTINTASDTTVEMSTLSDSGDFFCIRDVETTGTVNGNVDATGAVNCTGTW